MGKSHGLIITLIFFIILTLTLGIVTYYMAEGYKETIVKVQEAEKKVVQAKSEIATLTVEFEKIRDKVGYSVFKADDIVANMTADIKKAVSGTSNAKRAASYKYKDVLVVLSQAISAQDQEIARLKKENEDHRLVAEVKIKKDSRANKSGYDDQRKKAEAAYVDQTKKDSKALKDIEKEFQTRVKKVDRIKLEAKKLSEKYASEATEAEKEAAGTAEINVALSLILDELHNVNFDVPDGKILFVDQIARKVRLNIGKAEGLRVLTNFGVYPYDSLKEGHRIKKGTIEVTSILGEHESEARIVEDDNADPIMPYDMIYTSLWKAGKQTLYALTYNMDIDGDGKSDVETLKNLIDASGAKVAVWVDEDGHVHGTLTPEITAIITSNKSIADILVAADPAAKERIETNHMNLIKNAQRNNIREVKLAEFLRKIHYKPIQQIGRFRKPEGAVNVPLNRVTPEVSGTPVAPVYVPQNTDKTSAPHGPQTPIYKNTQGKTPPTSGKSSDNYFRKRTP